MVGAMLHLSGHALGSCDANAVVQTPTRPPCRIRGWVHMGDTQDMRLDMQESVCRGETSDVRWT